MEYTLREMMTVVAAREIKNDDIVFCGTGISMLAAMAAKSINAPDCVIFFETGAIDAALEEIPMAVADSRVMYHTASSGGLLDAFATMQNPTTGQKVIGILGAAQIDIFGNLNSTVIGDYFSPKTRFSGSGGGCDVASFVPRSMIFMQHEKRKFVKTLDYLTSPGHLDGPDGRRKAGLPAGGPELVITNMAVMRFDDTTKEMYLDGVYPGIEPEAVLEQMQFSVDISRAREVMPPSADELNILRDKCDPQRLIL
ncbi:CoA-transferase subunit beta [Desulfosarcina ovata]|uniref:CoA-transferase subunit beta n=1 Tax=Desulfosarcina ovata subsp. ovata TaxID=2752305 RepID=A0A5K8AA81_9BACT|nr:CoA-transferase [Desulfosarcina ovata]BBO88930.1 CoA-transferase subunit beta [Desulfosarcina ovata subsp. ovata]